MLRIAEWGTMLIESTEAFAAFARSQRIREGLTQAEFAERVGMSRRWVQSLESGTLAPSLAAALRLVVTLGHEMHLEEPLEFPEVDALFEALK